MFERNPQENDFKLDVDFQLDLTIIQESCMFDPKTVAIKLLQAISSDDSLFFNPTIPRYTYIDYHRIACHILFICRRCGNCCATGNPIRLSQEDIVRIAKSQKIPINKAIKKYTIPDPEKPEVWDFKHILPCKFYDTKQKTCRIYSERPRSCRIFPFLGIYGTEDKIKIFASCPGSIETSAILMTSLKEVSSDPILSLCSKEDARLAKEFFRAALNKI